MGLLYIFYHITFPWAMFTKLPCSIRSYFILLSLHNTYTIIMYCDYAGSVYGTTSICKQKSLHSYTQLQFTKLILLQTSLMYTTVYMHTVVVYKDTLVHDKIYNYYYYCVLEISLYWQQIHDIFQHIVYIYLGTLKQNLLLVNC